MHWIDDHKEFLWLSERDGWRHIYQASRSGRKTDVDHAWRIRRDRAARRRRRVGLGLLHRLARQPDPALSLPRPLRRHRPRARDARAREPGTHDYEISPDAGWAIHRFSAFDTSPDDHI